MGADPDRLRRDMGDFRRLAAAEGREPGPVTLMTSLPLAQPDQCRSVLEQYAAIGVERLVCGIRYDDLTEYERALDAIQALV
jgi:hypothetical protein